MVFKIVAISQARAKPLASISLRDKAESGEPRCRIGLRMELLAAFPLKDKDRFMVQIGSEADAGRLRLVRAKEGLAPRLLKGGATFDLGYVPELGVGAMAKSPARTEVIDAQTLQIVLPFNTDEAKPRPLGIDERGITLTLGKGRMAHLEAMAAAAHADAGALACRLLAEVIDDDKASEG